MRGGGGPGSNARAAGCALLLAVRSWPQCTGCAPPLAAARWLCTDMGHGTGCAILAAAVAHSGSARGAVMAAGCALSAAVARGGTSQQRNDNCSNVLLLLRLRLRCRRALVGALSLLLGLSARVAADAVVGAARDLCGVAVGVRSSGLQSALPAGLPTSQPLSELNCQQRAAHLRICRLSSRICRPRRSRAPLAATGWAWGTGGVARGEGGWSHWPTEGIVGGGALWLHHIAAWRR